MTAEIKNVYMLLGLACANLGILLYAEEYGLKFSFFVDLA